MEGEGLKACKVQGQRGYESILPLSPTSNILTRGHVKEQVASSTRPACHREHGWERQSDVTALQK